MSKPPKVPKTDKVLRWKTSLAGEYFWKEEMGVISCNVHLPGIPWYQSSVQHFLGSEQISKVTQGLYLSFSMQVQERLLWVLLLVSSSDPSQYFLRLCDFSLQQQISRRLRSKPARKTVGKKSKIVSGKSHTLDLIPTTSVFSLTAGRKW